MVSVLAIIALVCCAVSINGAAVKLEESGVSAGYAERVDKMRQHAKAWLRDPWTPSEEFMTEFLNEKYEMQPHNSVVIGWTPNEQQNSITLTMAVNHGSAPGAGGVWIGIGPTQTGGMIGGNPAVVRMNNQSQWECFAMHSDGFYTPSDNGHQNCELLSRSVQNGITTVQVRRPLIGCKPEDIDIVDTYNMRFFGAWGNNTNWGYHGTTNKWVAEIWAFQGPYVAPTFPPGTVLYDYNITLAPMQLPNEQDAYWCRGYELPGVQSRTRYHIVIQDVTMFPEAIGTATYHHYIFFECPGGLPRDYLDDENHACAVVPSAQCIVFFLGWAAGQGPLYIEHGLPIGWGDGAAQWGLIQSHIDNPDYRDNRPMEPGWGAFITYTPNLTPIESGVFGLYGGVPLGGMPPGEASYHTRAECPQRMIESAFGRDGMYITSVSPHMHGLGIYSKLEILRERSNGEWYEPYVGWEQTAWVNNWQGVRIFSGDGIQVLPTDRVRCHCKFDTRNETAPVRNGEGFEDEMCICYINYSPRHDISICAEFPPSVPSHPRDSGIGIAFADVLPFWWPVSREEEFEAAPPPANFCNKENSLE